VTSLALFAAAAAAAVRRSPYYLFIVSLTVLGYVRNIDRNQECVEEEEEGRQAQEETKEVGI